MVLKRNAKLRLLNTLCEKRQLIQAIQSEKKELQSFSMENFLNQIAGWVPKIIREDRNKEATYMEIPEGVKIKKNQLWCPYCGKVTDFKSDGMGNKKCIMCGIGDNCFYVRTVNKLWK